MSSKKKTKKQEKKGAQKKKKLNDKKEKDSSTETKALPYTSMPDQIKIASYNVNGIRAAIRKGLPDEIEGMGCDFICIQETKANATICEFPNYVSYWNHCSTKKGYSGTAIFSKYEPITVKYGIESKAHDQEGRVITLEFPNFFLVNSYVPNSGRKFVRLDYRVDEWDRAMEKYLKKLDKEKVVIWCGDLNVGRLDIDVHNPKTCKRSAGFSPRERESFEKLRKKVNLVDSYRDLYPNKEKAYTYWSLMRQCKQKDVGWRLDYFMVSDRANGNVVDNEILKQVNCSDHCPIVLTWKNEKPIKLERNNTDGEDNDDDENEEVESEDDEIEQKKKEKSKKKKKSPKKKTTKKKSPKKKTPKKKTTKKKKSSKKKKN
ncbi:DNA-(apurinic or apyrimidinic site) lyase [Anaeramoeba flamelloides]|uniref:DNA-(apurinic or apyrimidinic site) endonuclease n=1 Tax=Anaeramoeba flamelloides TaxID=1746091 RepID=A0ABQ8XCJ9_9EUKA|nr:DNA-(apurinic or apyrimidinic site) lyase [Anaeramoeba flamelloides]